MTRNPTNAAEPTTAGGHRQPCDAASEQQDSRRVALVAFYADADAAHRRLSLLMSRDAPMDRVSILGRLDASGDDPLGLYYPGPGERMRGWGRLGAVWGGIFGLLAGASGMFLLPGVGPVVAAGPLVASLTAGAAGAGAGGVLMAGAGAGAHLATAIHRLGIPADCLDDMHQRLAGGETLLMLLLDRDEAPRWRPLLEDAMPADMAPAAASESAAAAATPPDRPVALWELPFTGLAAGVRELA